MKEAGGGVEDGMVDQVGSITMEHGPKQYSTTRHQTLDWTQTCYLLGLKSKQTNKQTNKPFIYEERTIWPKYDLTTHTCGGGTVHS